jgi:hypothetical protein
MVPLDLKAIEAEFLQQCGSCEYGVDSAACNCPKRDYRNTMSALVAEVEQLREGLESLAVNYCEGWPTDHPASNFAAATAHRVRLILAGERP